MTIPDVCPVCLAEPPDADADVCRACARTLQELPEPRCRRCGGSIDGVLDACGECLQAGPRPWDHAVSVFPFGGAVRELIHRFKYQGHSYLVPVLVTRMARNWRQYGSGGPDLVTPAPLHWFKQLQRGYNQAELLAAGLAEALGAPLKSILRRRRWTAQQAMLDFSTRQVNMKEAFAVRRNVDLTGLRILVVDDVLTTGATLSEVTRTLQDSRAAGVSVITAARG